MDWKNILRGSDLQIDQVYRGGREGNAGDDPMNSLLGVSNQGGFRILGKKEEPRLVALMTSLSDAEWPDNLDVENGTFTYFGDNKTPGNSLHGTARYGNEILRRCFSLAHGSREDRLQVPAILAFATQGSGTFRDVRFLGLLVPGSPGVSPSEDLVAIWKSVKATRFQNYRAIFSVLDIGLVPRDWLDALISGEKHIEKEPAVLGAWRKTGSYSVLKAPKSKNHRTKIEQLPDEQRQESLIAAIRAKFMDKPTKCEKCAARLVELELKRVVKIEVTPASRDGGRDANGLLRIGGPNNGINLSFSVEAKCYAQNNSVGVKELSRLISRLRHREFGVLITTSYVAQQAYQEIVEDQHPIIVMSAVDIARVLDENGLGSPIDLSAWLHQFD